MDSETGKQNETLQDNATLDVQGPVAIKAAAVGSLLSAGVTNSYENYEHSQPIDPDVCVCLSVGVEKFGEVKI